MRSDIFRIVYILTFLKDPHESFPMSLYLEELASVRPKAGRLNFGYGPPSTYRPLFHRGYFFATMLQRSRKTGKAWKILKLKTPVYCGEGGKTPPFCPTLVPTVVASSLQGKLEKAALRRFMCPQLFCVLWTVEIASMQAWSAVLVVGMQLPKTLIGQFWLARSASALFRMGSKKRIGDRHGTARPGTPRSLFEI